MNLHIKNEVLVRVFKS